MSVVVKKILQYVSAHRELLIVIPLAIIFFGILSISVMMFGSLKSSHAQRTVQAVRDLVERVAPVIPGIPLSAPHMDVPQKKVDIVELQVSARSSAVIDVHSGEMIYEKNAFEKRSIASTTKLLTAMVVVDSVPDIDEYVTITQPMLNVVGVRVGCESSYSCSGVQLVVGEQLRIRDLLKAMLIGSANDAAQALALHVASSEDAFARRMNAQMQKLRLTGSNFCRPSGLEVDDASRINSCFSTARDVGQVAAIIAREARYKPIMEILGASRADFQSRDGTIKHVTQTTNDLLKQKVVIAGKTGFTLRAGSSFVGIADHLLPGDRFVTVVLDSSDRFADTSKIIHWVRKSFIW